MTAAFRVCIVALVVTVIVAIVTAAPPVEVRFVDVSSKPNERFIKYALSDGQNREETLTLDPATGTISVNGQYGFKEAKTGRKYLVRYIIDEAGGFRATVALLPSRNRIIKPGRPQDAADIGCALRNSLCG